MQFIFAKTPKTAAPLQISGYAPGYNTSEFLGFVLKIFIIPPPKFSGSATAINVPIIKVLRNAIFRISSNH